MSRSSAEHVHRGFSWGQLKETLSEIAPSAVPANVSDFRPTRRAAVEGVHADPELSDANQLISEAAAVVRQASEEVARIRADAAERIQRKQAEIDEIGRILKHTEEQLAAFEGRYHEATRETARWKAQATDVERMRDDYDRRYENDQRMIAFLERVVTEGKERAAGCEDRAAAAEERVKMLESQLKSLVGTMRQKLLPARDAHADAHDRSIEAPRGLGAFVAVLAAGALAAAFLLNPVQSAQADDLAALRGVWGARCDTPTLIVKADRVELRGMIEGVLPGRFALTDDRVAFRSSAGAAAVDVELAIRGENALVVTAASVGGLTVRPSQTLLVRCSLVPPDAGTSAA